MKKSCVDGQALEVLDESIAEACEPDFIEKTDESREADAESRKDAAGKGTIEQGEGVEDSDEVNGEDSADQKEEEEVILPG